MTPARSTRQLSAESSLVFRPPQSYSSDRYSHSCEDTAFYYLHLNSSEKAPTIPAQLCEAGPAPTPFVPGRMPAPPAHAAAAQGRAQGVNLIPGSATGELHAAHPGLPGSGSRAGPSRARPQEGCGKRPQRPGRRWRTRLPTEQHPGLKPRPCRRPPLPWQRPLPFAAGRGRSEGGGGRRWHLEVTAPAPCPGLTMAAQGSAGIQRPGAAGGSGGGGPERSRRPERPRRRQARSERCMVAGAGSTVGAGGAAGPPRTSVTVPAAPGPGASAAPIGSSGGRWARPWGRSARPGKTRENAPAPGEGQREKRCDSDFPVRWKKGMSLFCLTVAFAEMYKTLFPPS